MIHRSARGAAFLVLCLLLSGTVARPDDNCTRPALTQASKPKEETFGGLMKKLKVQVDADKYEGDLGKLLSRVLEKSATWKVTGTVIREVENDEKGDGSDELYRPPRLTITKEVCQAVEIHTLTQRRSRNGASLTTEFSESYTVKTKRIDRVAVHRHDIRSVSFVREHLEDKVYEIVLDTSGHTKDVEYKLSSKTIGQTGKGGEYDDRNRPPWTERVASLRLHVACEAEDAVAIGKAIQNLLQRNGGMVSFVDQTRP